MQDFVLLWRNFAGRCNYLQFTCRRHARYVTQVLSDCAIACLRLSGRQSLTPWVTYLAGAGTLTAAFASVCKTLGSLCALQIARAMCLLFRSSQVCVGQTLFLVRLIWGLCSPETLRLTLGSYPCSHSLGCSFCLGYAQKHSLDARFLFVSCRLNPMLVFGMESLFISLLSSIFMLLVLFVAFYYGVSFMDNFNYQLMHGLMLLLTSKPVNFVFTHSLLLGFVSGVISLVPFAIKRLLHVVIMIIVLLAAFYITDQVGLTVEQLFYYDKAFFIVNFVGNYIFGCIGGFVIANTIQRIRGEHEHVTNK